MQLRKRSYLTEMIIIIPINIVPNGGFGRLITSNNEVYWKNTPEQVIRNHSHIHRLKILMLRTKSY